MPSVAAAMLTVPADRMFPAAMVDAYELYGRAASCTLPCDVTVPNGRISPTQCWVIPTPTTIPPRIATLIGVDPLLPLPRSLAVLYDPFTKSPMILVPLSVDIGLTLVRLNGIAVFMDAYGIAPCDMTQFELVFSSDHYQTKSIDGVERVFVDCIDVTSVLGSMFRNATLPQQHLP